MHLRSRANHGQLMTVNSVSQSHLDGRCAITRTGQYRHARLPGAFLKQSCYLLPAITTADASSHPLEYPVVSLRGRLFHPSQLLAALQRP
jgi:hypothetical protein